MNRLLLLVDDEENITRSIVRLLRKEGYTIFTANSGKEGLILLEKHPINVIVSDQRMPNLSGIEFLKQAKSLYPKTVRIMLSGYSDLQSVGDALNSGIIYKFLTKPWEDQLLKNSIKEAFQYFEVTYENENEN